MVSVPATRHQNVTLILSLQSLSLPPMAKTILCLLLLAFGWGAVQAVPPATNSAGRVLMLEPSTMPLTTAKATLIVSPLTRTNGTYVGDFKVKVFPYFFKSDWGRLAINVSDADLAAISAGKTVAVTGVSTSAKNGVVRHIEITATPKDRDHGTACLWFMAAGQKMIFTPAYQFANKVLTTSLDPRSPLILSLR